MKMVTEELIIIIIKYSNILNNLLCYQTMLININRFINITQITMILVNKYSKIVLETNKDRVQLLIKYKMIIN